MGEIIPVPLGPSSDPARSSAAGDGKIINGFIEPTEGGKEQFAIYGDMGLDEFSTLGSTSSVRGVFNLGNKLYSVADEILYHVNASGTESAIGTILGTKSVRTSINDKATPQITIVADSTVYSLESDTLATITGVEMDLPSGVVDTGFIDGFTLYLIRDGRFFVSTINEDTTVDALDFAEAEGSRDEGIALVVFGLEVWIFGGETTEVWVNTGNADFPLERLAGSFMTVGCASKYTPKSFDNTMVWVTNRALVVRSESYVPRRISTHAVERDIQRTMDEGRAEDMEAIVYSEAGHEFYQLSGPDWTWVYDAATQTWHPKESYGMTRSRMTQYARCYDKHIVGDTEMGTLGHLTATAYDEYDDPLITTVQSPPMHAGAQRMAWNALYLDMEMGVGIDDEDTTLPTYNPKVMLSWSDDGGKNFSSERERSLGTQGTYKGSITFNRLGMSGRQGRIWKVKVSAAVKRVVMSASADADILAA